MTVTLGLWVVPLLVTLALWSWALLVPVKSAGDYSFDLMPLVRAVIATVGSLVAYLIWALLR